MKQVIIEDQDSFDFGYKKGEHIVTINMSYPTSSQMFELQDSFEKLQDKQESASQEDIDRLVDALAHHANPAETFKDIFKSMSMAALIRSIKRIMEEFGGADES